VEHIHEHGIALPGGLEAALEASLTCTPKCDGPLAVHHIQPRSMGGTAHDTSPLLTVCAYHHEWIESHRTAARALGLLLRKGVSA
jgi:hypothetical protein